MYVFATRLPAAFPSVFNSMTGVVLVAVVATMIPKVRSHYPPPSILVYSTFLHYHHYVRTCCNTCGVRRIFISHFSLVQNHIIEHFACVIEVGVHSQVSHLSNVVVHTWRSGGSVMVHYCRGIEHIIQSDRHYHYL